jgi:predicted RNA-binding protein with PUA-like domain
MAYWLLKTEPGAYSFDDLVRDGETSWDGVRNYQARNNLQAMKKGDRCVIYHSVGPKEAVGIAKVTRAAYADPTSDDVRWLAVDIAPEKRLTHPVSLARMKEHPLLSSMALVKQSRLSVCPVTADEFKVLLSLAKKA